MALAVMAGLAGPKVAMSMVRDFSLAVFSSPQGTCTVSMAAMATWVQARFLSKVPVTEDKELLI